jgi:hypothetical protein
VIFHSLSLLSLRTSVSLSHSFTSRDII